ncbi:helix-turn-helix transcriptional regulator [Yokenella regensburgei]|uniref:helix-turn-helix transcriptional regulator n=1 Tax=Yokenella regensburgei TaxID=158877 RepID=UPI0013763E79|nr:LuxR family transcriptional regulator [Yokenella regensburgei]KAF1366718.1 DNA-binding NarL/FixJ family response regulator [Yokenella regensburgei]
MNTSYQIYSQDAFLTVGISSLLDSILSMNILFESKKFHILLVSNIFLLNLTQLCKKLDANERYFIIGCMAAWRLLNGSGALILKGFIDISKSVIEIKHDLHFMLKGIKTPNSTSIKAEKTALSPCERLVLKYISSGMTAASIARRLGLSVKTISSQKRNVMKKLCVSNNQQLLIKAQIANYLY